MGGYLLLVPLLFFFERSFLLTFVRFFQRGSDFETAQAKFGLVAFPRTALLLLASISGAATELLGASHGWIMGTVALTALGWLLVTLRDGWTATRSPGA